MKRMIPIVKCVTWNRICVFVDFVSYAVRKAASAIHAVLTVDGGVKRFVTVVFAKTVVLVVILVLVKSALIVKSEVKRYASGDSVMNVVGGVILVLVSSAPSAK